MLNFNRSGLLVPDNKINSTIQEIENEFVLNIPTLKRKEIFDAYVKFNTDFKNRCNLDELCQWVNGSYVTKKQNHGDIDIVTFLDYKIVRQLGSQLDDFKFPNSEINYSVDAYIVEVYPENHKERIKFVSDKAYWMERFTKTRRIRGNRLSKGFLEIIY